MSLLEHVIVILVCAGIAGAWYWLLRGLIGG